MPMPMSLIRIIDIILVPSSIHPIVFNCSFTRPECFEICSTAICDECGISKGIIQRAPNLHSHGKTRINCGEKGAQRRYPLIHDITQIFLAGGYGSILLVYASASPFSRDLAVGFPSNSPRLGSLHFVSKSSLLDKWGRHYLMFVFGFMIAKMN